MPDGITGRTADPYRDLDVIDSHAPGTNQSVIGAFSLALLAAATGLCAGCEAYKLSARLRGIAVVPTVVEVSADGTVLARLAP